MGGREEGGERALGRRQRTGLILDQERHRLAELFKPGSISCYRHAMAQLLVRHLDDDVKAKLQRRARRHGRSTEEEVREILRNAVRDEDMARAPLGSRLADRFAGLGLTEDIPELRGQPARPADFES